MCKQCAHFKVQRVEILGCFAGLGSSITVDFIDFFFFDTILFLFVIFFDFFVFFFFICFDFEGILSDSGFDEFVCVRGDECFTIEVEEEEKEVEEEGKEVEEEGKDVEEEGVIMVENLVLGTIGKLLWTHFSDLIVIASVIFFRLNFIFKIIFVFSSSSVSV